MSRQHEKNQLRPLIASEAGGKWCCPYAFFTYHEKTPTRTLEKRILGLDRSTIKRWKAKLFWGQIVCEKKANCDLGSKCPRSGRKWE